MSEDSKEQGGETAGAREGSRTTGERMWLGAGELTLGPPGCGSIEGRAPQMPAYFPLCCERHPVCRHQNRPWGVLFGILTNGQAELVTVKQEVRRIGLRHPHQLKKSSPKAGNLQVTQSHLVMGTLAFTPP